MHARFREKLVLTVVGWLAAVWVWGSGPLVEELAPAVEEPAE